MQFYEKFRAKFLIFYFYRGMLVKMVHEIFLKIGKYKNLAQNLYTYLLYLPFYLPFILTSMY